MRLTFRESFTLPVEAVFPYFETPANWPKLYGSAGTFKDCGEGWFSIPLKRFPFPLIAKATAVEPLRLARWTFRGFWKGEGEVRFSSEGSRTVIEGYEDIGLRWLPLWSGWIEKRLLEPQFKAVWAYGWKRLRKLEAPPSG